MATLTAMLMMMVEQDAGNEGDGGRRREDDIRHMEAMDGGERGDTDDAAADERSRRLAEAEVEHADVSEQDSDGTADGYRPKNTLWHVEEQREAARRNRCRKRVVEVDVAGTEADRRKFGDASEV